MERKLREQLEDGKFKNVSAGRSRNMSSVRGARNRSTEARLRMALVRFGIGGWTLTPKDIAGKPDFWFEKYRIAVFVDGCFWHGCECTKRKPRSNGAYWREKWRRNKERDAAVSKKLTDGGVRVIRFWEHELREGLPAIVDLLRRELS